MITAAQNSVFILALLLSLSQVIYPFLFLKIVAILLITYYVILVYLNIRTESIFFLISLVAFLLYLVYRLIRSFIYFK